MSPLVLGATRRTYLINYVSSQKNSNNGFGDFYESTASALEILNYFGSLGDIDSQMAQQYLRNEINTMFESNNLNVYDLYYLLRSIDILNRSNTEVPNDLKARINLYLDDLNQTGGGFSPTNNTDSFPTMISTYYALEVYSTLDENFQIPVIHKDWVKACIDTVTGGYKGNNGQLPPSLMNTYCAVLIMNRASALNELDNVSATITYVKSFFINIISDQDKYGGYLPDLTAEHATLSSTYYSIKILNLLSTITNKNPTLNWVYGRQNFLDGGFSDIKGGLVQGSSSLIGSYFAVESLLLLGGSLDYNIWMVEFNYIILIILIVVFAIIIALALFLWRRRKL